MKISSKNILVTGLHKGPGSYGGVTNFIRLLFDNLDSSTHNLVYFSLGKSPKSYSGPDKPSRAFYIFYHIIKIFSFSFILKKNRISLTHVNTGLTRISILRDGLFSFLSIMLGYPTFLFFHGWKEDEYNLIKSNKVLRLLFLKFLNLHSNIGVLSNLFKSHLIDLGVDNQKITVFTTMVECDKYKPSEITGDNKALTFLFCSHPLIKSKGIYEFLYTIPLIKRQSSDTNFIVMGGGEYLDKVKKVSKSIGIEKDVVFTGYLSGDEKLDIFSKCDALVFPSYTEGFPTTVIEAMASGLAIICTYWRPKRFLKTVKMVFLTDNPPQIKDIHAKIISMISSDKILRKCNHTIGIKQETVLTLKLFVIK